MNEPPEDTVWSFHVDAIRLSPTRCRVTVVGDTSGTKIVREGRFPMWELIRILGGKGSNTQEADP